MERTDEGKGGNVLRLTLRDLRRLLDAVGQADDSASCWCFMMSSSHQSLTLSSKQTSCLALAPQKERWRPDETITC